jgi:hypothetical protein
MEAVRHKVFVSYHHANDQEYANQLRDFYGRTDTIIDRSLPEEINSTDNDYILSQIRQKHLKDSTVTIVLIGQQTWARKWVDWEIYSSLRPYENRTVNGLLGILLPNADINKLPPRFAANYKLDDTKTKQIGYALLITWNMISPPPLWQLLADGPIVQERRKTLSEWVEYAFNRRNFKDIIDNSLPRYINNKPINSFTWW